MTNTVEFVPAGLGLGEHAIALPGLDKVSIEIAAGFLRGDNLANHLFTVPAQFWQRSGLQREPHSFQPLVNVGIGVDGPALGGGGFSLQAEEIVHAAMVDQFLPHARDT